VIDIAWESGMITDCLPLAVGLYISKTRTFLRAASADILAQEIDILLENHPN
jgi:hypothetical protein